MNLRSIVAAALSSLPLLSAQTITFGSNESVELESGWVAFSQPSGFTAAQRAQILQLVNAKLLAAGINLTATAGDTGPCRIVISDSQAPPITGVQGSETDIGAGDGEPAIVFMAEHPDAPDFEHVHDIANSIKALIAAKHGAGANYHALADAMTQNQGAARYQDLAYGSTAATQMQLNSALTSALTETSVRPTDLRYRIDTTPGRRLRSLDTVMTYAPGLHAGSQFGHLRADGTFVAIGQAGLLETAPASFFFDRRGVDFAIRLQSGAICALSNGKARVSLQNVNPANFDVFDSLQVLFDADGNHIPDATVSLQTVGDSTGGFYHSYYPGSGEDLFLSASINVNASFLSGQPAQVANPADVIYTRVRSFEGQFANEPAFLVGELFSSSTPTPIPFPGIWFSGSNHFVLQSGSIGPAGMLGNIFVPGGLSGHHLLLQAVSLSLNAGNGLLATTDGMTVTFL